MINLLPPNFKEQVAYSKRNALLVRYLVLVVGVTVVLSGVLVGARYYLDGKVKASGTRLMAAQKLATEQYKGVEAEATSANGRLAAVENIQKTQTHFSLLLSDLAKATPKGVQLTGISLTGDDKQPVRVQAQAVDYKTALSFRDSIAQSPRISAADIESITQTDVFTVTIIFAFNPGDAK